jgi:hypothetical protein
MPMDLMDWWPAAWMAAVEIGAWLVIAAIVYAAFRGRHGRGSPR